LSKDIPEPKETKNMSEVQNNEEIVENLLKTQGDPESLTEEQLDIYLEKAPTYEFEETQPEEPSPPVEPEIPEKETTAIDDSSIPEFDKHKEHRDALQELNKYKQLYKDRDSKINKMKEDPDFAKKQLGIESEVTVDPDKDYLDDRFLAEMKSELDSLKQWKQDREQEDVKTRAELEREKEQLGLFGEIQQVQGQFPSLKTSENFQSINDKYIEWQGNVQSAGLDTDRYFNDEAYKKALDAKGYKLGVVDADVPKMLDIYSVYENYKKEKDGGYNTSFTRALRNSDVYEKASKSKYGSHQLADDDALNAAIEQRASEPDILDTGSAPTGSMDLGDVVNEMEILVSKTRKSPADMKRIVELETIMEQFM